MSSQYTTEIPISASHHHQPFKLLELPPELLTLLESDSPPPLTIISSSSSSATSDIATSSSASPSPGLALLCHSNKKYQMRQKNSSNPIMILEPSSAPSTGAASIPDHGVTVIAKVEGTIELILLDEEERAGASKGAGKVNKWHEKFAKSRAGK